MWVETMAKEPLMSTAVYTVDGGREPFLIPENKGHEAMVYLTYIIDHYHNLSDITLFMHAHLVAWHNNVLLHEASPNLVRMLSSPKVIRDGYFNLRCHHDPGCPAHIRPGIDDDPKNLKPQARVFAKAWTELFPGIAVPEVVAQPCCAQFALSRERIQALPRERYEALRQWLLDTTLEDQLSGRVMEYVWQFIWTGRAQYCIKEHICYCDGFGICFGGEEQHRHYFELDKEQRALRKAVGDIEHPVATGTREPAGVPTHNVAKAKKRIAAVDAEMVRLRQAAVERGRSAASRALQVGRPWRKGDGF